MRSCSSVGQSEGLLIPRSSVRARSGATFSSFCCVPRVGAEFYCPVVKARLPRLMRLCSKPRPHVLPGARHLPSVHLYTVFSFQHGCADIIARTCWTYRSSRRQRQSTDRVQTPNLHALSRPAALRRRARTGDDCVYQNIGEGMSQGGDHTSKMWLASASTHTRQPLPSPQPGRCPTSITRCRRRGGVRRSRAIAATRRWCLRQH